MVRVHELRMGQVVQANGFGEERAVVIGIARHPQYKDLVLVIWWLEQRKEFSFDALADNQEVGKIVAFNVARVQSILETLERKSK